MTDAIMEMAERYGLTLAVGGLPTGLDRLVTAYEALANDGILLPLKWYQGQELPEPRRVLSAQTAREITAFLADPMARLPSFARMGSTEYPFPVAVKTGTSQGYRDAWVAFARVVARSLPPDRVAAWLTRKRTAALKAFTGES